MAKEPAPGMRDVARAAGVSVATVSRALRGATYLREETRLRVEEAARQLGYEFNPHVGNLMSALRGRAGGDFVGNLAMLWYDTALSEKHPWRQVLRRHAEARARELGYSLSIFDRKEHSPERLARIMFNQGIDGVIITPAERSLGKVHMHFPFERFAWVSMGWSLYAPAFHSVRFDHFQALRLAIHHARRQYGEGIAALLDLRYDRRSDGSYRGGFLAHHPGGPARAQKLIFDLNALNLGRMRRVYQAGGFRCLIAQARMQLPEELFSWFPREDVLYLDEPVQTGAYGFIDYQHGLLSRWAVDLVVAAIQRREKGVPAMPFTVHVPPRWVPGRALR